MIYRRQVAKNLFAVLGNVVLERFWAGNTIQIANAWRFTILTALEESRTFGNSLTFGYSGIVPVCMEYLDPLAEEFQAKKIMFKTP